MLCGIKKGMVCAVCWNWIAISWIASRNDSIASAIFVRCNSRWKLFAIKYWTRICIFCYLAFFWKDFEKNPEMWKKQQQQKPKAEIHNCII